MANNDHTNLLSTICWHLQLALLWRAAEKAGFKKNLADQLSNDMRILIRVAILAPCQWSFTNQFASWPVCFEPRNRRHVAVG